MKLKTAQQRYSAFTLVELLIVIALLGVIATIVISAINPIEQANRAADAGMKADASQLLSAIQRYYATQNNFPWNSSGCPSGDSYCLNGATDSPDEHFGGANGFVSADDAAVGVCGVSGSGCRTAGAGVVGTLVSSMELTNEFLNKSWVGATLAENKLYVGKAAGASSPVYVCWAPKSSSNRQVLITSATTNANKLWDVTQNFPGGNGAGMPTAGTCTGVSDNGWTTGACAECLPE